MRVLVVNAGSSSLKLTLLGDADEVLQSRQLPADGPDFDTAALEQVLAEWARPDVVGHRVVHGGPDLAPAVRLDDEVEQQLRSLVDLAPLHQPKSLAGIDAVTAALPDIPAVACFDTAFHRTLAPAAYTYAVPAEWQQRWGVRRYGFHGLSHAYCSRRAPELAGPTVGRGLRLVSCHLGAGASLAAVVDGRCVDTTMGFTPLEGLVMATRSGSVDPGLVLWLEEHAELRPHEVADALEHSSGLTALCGTGRMDEIESRVAAGDERARLALDVYLHRLVGLIGSMAAAAGGLDVLAFTGGVGENSSIVRSEAARRLAWLGVLLDDRRNDGAAGDADVTGDEASVRTVVVSAREDLEIARAARALLVA